MNTLIFPLVYLLISLIFGLGLIVLSHKLLSRLMKARFSIDSASMPFNILASGLIISIAMLMSESAKPMVSLISLLARSQDAYWPFTAAIYILAFYGITVAMAFFIIFGSLRFFSRMTGSLDEIAELKKGNIGVALLLSTLLVTMTIFLKSPLVALFEAIIPYPDFSY